MSQKEMRVFLTHLLDEMTFDWHRREVKLVGHITIKGESQVLSELSGKQTPVNLCKNWLRFKLKEEV
jgi:hypothetical protein